MRKTIFTILVALFAVAVSAQTEKENSAQLAQGDSFITGGLNFSVNNPERTADNTTTEQPSTTEFGANLYGGYFMSENLVLGIGLGFDSYKWKDDAEEDYEETETRSLFTIAPSLRFYNHLNEKLSLYGDLGVGLGFGKYKVETTQGGTTTTEPETDLTSMRIGLTPGFNYMMSDKIGLELRYGFIGYESVKREDAQSENEYSETDPNKFGIDLDLSSIEFSISLFL